MGMGTGTGGGREERGGRKKESKGGGSRGRVFVSGELRGGEGGKRGAMASTTRLNKTVAPQTYRYSKCTKRQLCVTQCLVFF